MPRVVPDDADNDHVIACAVAARADIIVSGDKHLLNLREYRGIRIVTPALAGGEHAPAMGPHLDIPDFTSPP